MVVVELVGEVRDRPALVAGRDIEELRDARRKALDAELGVEEQGADFGGAHQILQVAVRAADAFEFQLQLGVERLKLLVHRLQFFLRGFELFSGGAIFLVNRLQFFVGGAQFLVGGFVFFAAELETLARDLQLLLELFDYLAVAEFEAGCGCGGFEGAAVDEEDECEGARFGGA
jgi:hypothetical protein